MLPVSPTCPHPSTPLHESPLQRSRPRCRRCPACRRRRSAWRCSRPKCGIARRPGASCWRTRWWRPWRAAASRPEVRGAALSACLPCDCWLSLTAQQRPAALFAGRPAHPPCPASLRVPPAVIGPVDSCQQLLRIEGMTCSACSSAVEAALRALPGVQAASVNPLSGLAEVSFDPELTGPRHLKEAVEGVGFEAAPVSGQRLGEALCCGCCGCYAAASASAIQGCPCSSFHPPSALSSSPPLKPPLSPNRLCGQQPAGDGALVAPVPRRRPLHAARLPQ